MKLCVCFSALVSSSFRATTATTVTTSAVQPAPCVRRWWGGTDQWPAQGRLLLLQEARRDFSSLLLMTGGLSPALTPISPRVDLDATEE